MGNRKLRIKLAVEERYSRLASAEYSGGCCGIANTGLPSSASEVSLGCGSPLAYAEVEPGMTVLDAGCGGGVDVFAASKKVGPTGRVIGVDATVKMVARARRTAEENGYSNVEFRLGEMEDLPVKSNTCDIVISNCAVNLVSGKERAYREMRRTLKSGGRLVISDILAEKDLSDAVRRDLDKWSRCMGGALTMRGLKRVLTRAGFGDFEVLDQKAWTKGTAIGLPLLSVTYSASRS